MSGYPRLAADSGRIVASPDVPTGELRLALFEVPQHLRTSDYPTLLLAASTATAGWKRQYVEVDHAGRTQLVRTAPRKSVLGRTATKLDETEAGASVEVLLYDADQWLMGCREEDLKLGDNLAVIGTEVIQFGEATPVGAGRFRLGRVLRGRVETQSVIHSKGEPFVLLERGGLQPVRLSVWARGSPVSASAQDGSAQCRLIPAFKGLAPSGLRLTF